MTGEAISEGKKLPRTRRPQTARSGGIMSGFLVMFACLVALVCVAMYLFDKSEKTAYHKMQGDFNEWKSSYTSEINKKYEDANSAVRSLAEGNVAQAQAEAKEAKELVDKLLVEMQGLRNEHKLMTDKIAVSDRVARDARKQTEAFQEHAAKLREQLLILQKEIAGKRVVHQHQWKGAFPMEVYPGGKATDKTKTTKKRSTKSH